LLCFSIASSFIKLPLALASGSYAIKGSGFSPIVSAKAGNIQKTDHALKCVAIDKTAIEKGVTINATARMTDDRQKGVAKFLEKHLVSPSGEALLRRSTLIDLSEAEPPNGGAAAGVSRGLPEKPSFSARRCEPAIEKAIVAGHGPQDLRLSARNC